MRSDMCERFCRMVAAGGISQADAYVKAGYSPGAARREAVKRASALARRHSGYIDELKRQHAEARDTQMLWTRQDAIKALRRAAEDCYDGNGCITDKKTYISAVVELNKICGYYADAKKEAKEADISGIDIDAIMAGLGYSRTEPSAAGGGA